MGLDNNVFGNDKENEMKIKAPEEKDQDKKADKKDPQASFLPS